MAGIADYFTDQVNQWTPAQYGASQQMADAYGGGGGLYEIMNRLYTSGNPWSTGTGGPGDQHIIGYSSSGPVYGSGGGSGGSGGGSGGGGIDRGGWEDKAQKRYDKAYSGAADRMRSDMEYAFRQQGADPSQYSDRIDEAITRAMRDAPEFDYKAKGDKFSYNAPDFGSFAKGGDALGENLVSDIVQRQTNQQRGLLGEQFGTGWERNTIADTADDPILDAILGEQRGDAELYLERAMKRGNLGQEGYDAALGKLGESALGGMGRLQDIGGGILSDYRGQLSGIADNAYSAAGAYDFANPGGFNAQTYFDQANDRTSSLLGGLEGDVRNAVGGEQFFDPSKLISYGGREQGLFNPGRSGTATGLLGALQERSQTEDTKRGLGTQGSF